MLDATMKTQLEGYLQNLRTPIRLIASLDSSDRSTELRELLVEIAPPAVHATRLTCRLSLIHI